MGQMAYGILLGIPAPEDSESLIESWEKENKAEIKKLMRNSWSARYEIVPYFEGDNELGAFIGFWVAVGGSGKDGISYLDAFCLDDMEVVYKDEIVAAKKRWLEFANWATICGKNFIQPKLYLLQTEVA